MSLVKQWQRDLFSYKYAQQSIIALGAVVCIVLGVYTYDYFRTSRESLASKAFLESYSLYEQALAFESRKENAPKLKDMWEEVEMAFGAAYQQYKNSSLAPYFLAFQTEALIKQGKADQALEGMNQIVMGMHHPLRKLYAVKRALLKIDTLQMTQEGVDELIQLAHDHNNPVQDEALYYLGLYHWNRRDVLKARDAWEQVIELGKTGKNPMPSPWYDLAHTKLASL